MPSYMKISTVPGIWETVLECDGCDATGTVSAEVAVVDFENGGYLTTAPADCPDCDGRGWRHLTEDEEEQFHAMPTLQ